MNPYLRDRALVDVDRPWNRQHETDESVNEPFFVAEGWAHALEIIQGELQYDRYYREHHE